MRAILAIGFLVASVVPVSAQAPATGYAPAGDTTLHYEVRGAGDPIVLLHGGGGSAERSWPKEYDALGRDFMLIKMDSRGHGRSSDGAGPLTYGRLAADVIRLLDHQQHGAGTGDPQLHRPTGQVVFGASARVWKAPLAHVRHARNAVAHR